MDRKAAMRFILMMGLVSLFGDISYEGARAMTGPYLAFLGASAVTVGFVSGLGEFLGYGLRLVSGVAADKTRAYWPLTFLGYGLILAIPCLAFTGSWQIAALFIILERAGKAVRSPARDALLSYATKQVGRGWGFAVHEAMDQIGAVAGPLIFAAVLFWKNNFRLGFGILFIPTLLTILSLIFAKSYGRAPEDFETPRDPQPQPAQEAKLAPAYWHYAAFSCLCVAGLVNFQIISYHWKVHALLLDAWIPLVYALTMAVDGVAALAVGKAYDRWGFKTLGLVPIVTLLVPFFVFLPSSAASTVVVAVLWGIVMGMHETIMRAAIADLTHIQKRGFGYGFFNTIYGGAWFLGSFTVGALYGLNIRFVLLFVVVLELAAFAVFWKFLRRAPR
ncbi:MFS transporter [Candidatus Velamenicoccus archaeovorus]|uniref:MFS transporter n=1 Tax=Velamenicoccus archaeovorus TaxID=1930593 RepID=A0A410P354_VELA1|nr:MFS transporter [Candidatus Velamenicoccus archaeovorus]QAT16586.1 MFS transporter [Candidatus Velamenicoccus archaeovorus]